MHSKKNYVKHLYFGIVFIIATSSTSAPTLFKSSDALSETKTTLKALIRNHPYVTTCLVWLSLRGLTKHLATTSYAHSKIGGYRIDVNKDIYHTVLNEKCAIFAAFMIDYFNNKNHSLPSRCVSNLHALVKSYSESTNLQFIKKSFDWTVETIKSIPSAIVN